ncbi:histidine kinase [Chitinophaga pendula]|uniref:sensor histidine kinase n=1 Tax=Chitinophaga TaxID=79328 RepID=UPI0012FD986F|nr:MULTISPECIES: histidine kinase [Chitinophaga]UCJ09278.1 histidine kinase [Chitinophaga pendula]
MTAQHWFARYKLHHLLFWTAFFVVWLTLRIDDYPTLSLTIKAGVLKVFTLAGAVYVTNLFLIPRLLYQRQYLAFVAGFTLLVMTTGWLVIRLLDHLLQPYVAQFKRLPNSDLGTQLYDVYIPLFFMVGAAAGIKFYVDQLRTSHRLQQALRSQAEQELLYLKAQINPHAIFNSLNAIYFLIDKKNTAARDTLMKFSSLLRYQLYDCNTDTIPVEKEVLYLEHYVAIQRVRQNEDLEVRFEADPALQGLRIAPLLLIPFVENAFKHVATSGGQQYIRISLQREADDIVLSTSNTCYEHVTATPGIGLANARRRLELLYPGRHHLSLYQEGGVFQVFLKLSLL